MILRLFDHLPGIAQRIADADDVLVGLDYDGTLTPIVDDPSRAVLEPERRDALRDLASRPRVTVAIISGRALDDVRTLVDLPGLIYAGNHGLDIAGPGLRFIDSAALVANSSLRGLALHLAAETSRFPGVWIEDKALTLSVHLRRANPDHWEPVRRAVERAIGGTPYRVSEGNRVLEIRPRVNGTKGVALRWIRDALGSPLTVYAGDDVTDEDAFRALPEAITIRVGETADTCAQFAVGGPVGIWSFLAWLNSALRHTPTSEATPT